MKPLLPAKHLSNPSAQLKNNAYEKERNFVSSFLQDLKKREKPEFYQLNCELLGELYLLSFFKKSTKCEFSELREAYFSFLSKNHLETDFSKFSDIPSEFYKQITVKYFGATGDIQYVLLELQSKILSNISMAANNIEIAKEQKDKNSKKRDECDTAYDAYIDKNQDVINTLTNLASGMLVVVTLYLCSKKSDYTKSYLGQIYPIYTNIFNYLDNIKNIFSYSGGYIKDLDWNKYSNLQHKFFIEIEENEDFLKQYELLSPTDKLNKVENYVTDKSIISDIRNSISESYHLQKRQDILENIVNAYENKNFILFKNIRHYRKIRIYLSINFIYT